MRVRLHPVADGELDGAAEWYSTNASKTVAANFTTAYDATAQLIADNPGIGTPSVAGTRTLRFRGSPMLPSIGCILTTQS